MTHDPYDIFGASSGVAVVADESQGVSVSVDAPCGARLLDDIEQFLSRFVAYPEEHARVSHVLWIAHAWFMDAWESTPRLAFLSPEPGSGKSRALEVTEPLVPRAIHAVNATPAALFRKVSDPAGLPTILFDEIDTIFGPKAKENEELRGMLNAGHRRGAVAYRAFVKNDGVGVEELPSYCAVALAGLDGLPDTIMARSVVIRMRRRAPGERVEPWRHRLNAPEAQVIADRLAEWANQHQNAIIATWPDMPDEIQDREADVWESLLAVADLAGGEWPDRARRSAVAAVAAKSQRPPTLGVQLLRDLRHVFFMTGLDRIKTEDLLDRLHEIDESPWGYMPRTKKPLDARALSFMLTKYDIGPKNLRIDGRVVKGYDFAEFGDAWARYLAGAPSDSSATGATPLHP